MKELDIYIIGIECTDEESTSGLLKVELGKLRDENQKLCERVKAPEHTISGMQQGISPTHLTRELKALTSPSNAIHHGPDTTEHFPQFTMDTLRSECQQYICS